MDFFRTPVYLIAFNRLDALRRVTMWLEQAGYENIHIIDNASTYPPLLEYLSQSPHRVHRMAENHGHFVLWESGAFDDVINMQNFVLSDCDVLPTEDCPADVVARLAAILKRYPDFTKVGLSLRIDDLPDRYAFRDLVMKWERPYWERTLENGALYEATVDTTFAYYRPGIRPDERRWCRSIRTAPPLSARHLPWYADTGAPTAEDLYYQRNVRAMSSQWSTTDPLILKEQNLRFMNQVCALRHEVFLLKQKLDWRQQQRERLMRVVDWLSLDSMLYTLRRKFDR